MHIRRVLLFCLALIVGLSAAPFAQNAQKKEEKKLNKQEQADVDTLVGLVDSASSGLPIGFDLPTKVSIAPNKDSVVTIGSEGMVGEVPITWESNHFMRGQGGETYIPFTVRIDPKRLSGKSVAMFVRMVDKKKAAMPAGTTGEKTNEGDRKKPVEHPWNGFYFVDVPENGLVSRAMVVPGGEYEFFIAVKDKNTGDKKQVAKAGLMRKDISVPNYNTGELTTSSVIIASSVEPVQTAVTNEEQQDHPYTFGTTRIVPKTDGQFKTADELNVVFFIYGVTPDASKKPDVQVEYNFHRKTPEGEKYFNKTAPQEISAKTLPEAFDTAAGHPLPGSIVIPLASFPPGEYRLEIKVTDKPSGKTLTRDVPFTVSA